MKGEHRIDNNAGYVFVITLLGKYNVRFNPFRNMYSRNDLLIKARRSDVA